MNSINFIGKHLLHYKGNIKIKIYDCDTICAFTGDKIYKGVKKKEFIKDSFTDIEYIKYQSDYCCVESILCMSEVVPNGKGKFNSLRSYSFIVTENELKIIKNRQDIVNFILNQEIPNIIAYSFKNKKHISYKSIINYNSSDCVVSTDNGNIKFILDNFKEAYDYAMRWYSVVPGKEKMQQTYFTKDEIQNGVTNYKKI